MSHAHGKVFQEIDGNWISVGHFEYSGTVDIAFPIIRLTQEEVSRHWRKNPWKYCTCGKEPQQGLMIAEYGGTVEWTGRICLTCMVIIDCNPYGENQ